MNLKLFTTLFLLNCSSIYSADTLWHFIPQKEINTEGKRKIIPQKYIIVKLNDTLFKSIQQKTPVEAGGDFAVLELPSPDGKLWSFRLTKSAVMEKELADKYPELQTYKATEIGSPAISAKLDYTSAGFHAMVFDTTNPWFIDPYSNKNTGYYICYYKKDYDKSPQMLKASPVEKKGRKKHKCRNK